MGLTARDVDYFLTVLSDRILFEPTTAYMFDLFAPITIDFSKGNGDTVQLNRYPLFGDDGMTESDRKLTETTTVGTADPVNQSVVPVTVVLDEYAGPYNPVTSSPAPLAVTEKTARQAQANLINADNPESFFNSIGGNSLKQDHDKFHDRVLCNKYLETTNIRNPDGVVDGSTATSGTGSTFDTADLQFIKEGLARNNAPKFSDELYWACIDPRMERHLRQDSDFKEAMHYADPSTFLRGEIGVFEGFRFFCSNNIPTATVNSLTAYQGVFFGSNAVGFGEGEKPVEVRLNSQTDYDRVMYLIWLVNRGYKLLDERFIYKSRTFAA